MRLLSIVITLSFLTTWGAPADAGAGRWLETARGWLKQRLGRGRPPAAVSTRRPPAGKWLMSDARPGGVALVLHGMNIRPSRMDSIARTLNRCNVDCYRGVLTGHDGDMAALKRVTRDSLLRDTNDAYRKAARRARRLGVPLYLVGYSLGALLANDLASHDKKVRFDRMILFAPELIPRPVANLLKPLVPFKSLVLPGSFPKQYSVHRGTPMAVYGAMFDSVKALGKKGLDGRVPALIFADPHDMMANTPALERKIKRDGLADWKLVKVRGEGKNYRKGKGHLLIDREAVGASAWSGIERQIQDFVQRGPGGQRSTTRGPDTSASPARSSRP